MLNESYSKSQEKSLLINKLSLEMSKEKPEEPMTMDSQRLEDIHYFQELLQIPLSFNGTFENS
jgi:hypothetical protein